MTDVSYNKMSSIKIGGTYLNNIDTSYGLVSLDVSGHTFLRGNLYVGGATNITGNGGFSGNDLTLSGNLTIGKDIYSTGTEMNIRGNGIVIDVSNGATFLTGNADMLFQSGGAGSLYFQTGGNGNLVFGAGNGTATFDASGDGTFISRKGSMIIQADKEDVVLFGAGVNSEIRLETDTQDIVLNPAGTGALGTVVVNGQIELLNGLKCTEATNTLYVLDTNYLEIIGSTGAQIDLYQSGVSTKSVTLGLNTSTNNGYIGSGGANVDFSVSAGRYLRLTNPLYCDYTPVDITTSAQIGYQLGNSYTTAMSVGNITVVTTFTLPIGVWLVEAYSGYAQASNNRAISISASSTTMDNSRAQWSTQQNSSFQQLCLSTVWVSSNAASNIYFLSQIGSNGGSFSSVQHYLRRTRIA